MCGLSLPVCAFFVVCIVPNIFAVADTDLDELKVDVFVCTLLCAVVMFVFLCVLNDVVPASVAPVAVLYLGPMVVGVLFAVVMYGTFFPGTDVFVTIGAPFVCGVASGDLVVGVAFVFDCGVSCEFFVVIFAALKCGVDDAIFAAGVDDTLFAVIGVTFV